MNITNLSIVLDEKLTTVGVQYGNGKTFGGDTYTFVARSEHVKEWDEGLILLVQNNDQSLHLAKLVRIDEDVCFDEHDSRTYSYVVSVVDMIEVDQLRADVNKRADHIRNYRRKAQRQALRDSYAAGTLQLDEPPAAVAKFVEGGPVFGQAVGRQSRSGWVKIMKGDHPFKLGFPLHTQIRFTRKGHVGFLTGNIIRVNQDDNMVIECYTVLVGASTMTVLPETIMEYHV